MPGSGGGSFPDRTQLENVVGETLQYAAAACRVSKRGVTGRVSGVDWEPKVIFELMAEMTLEVALGHTAAATPSLNCLVRLALHQLIVGVARKAAFGGWSCS